MAHEGLDFKADLVSLYKDIRVIMAETFSVEDFGPKSVDLAETDGMSKKEIVVYKKNWPELNSIFTDLLHLYAWLKKWTGQAARLATDKIRDVKVISSFD